MSAEADKEAYVCVVLSEMMVRAIRGRGVEKAPAFISSISTLMVEGEMWQVTVKRLNEKPPQGIASRRKI